MAEDSDKENQKEYLEFLYAAIIDIQGTIRAVDLKLNVLVVVLVIPLTSLKDTFSLLAKGGQSVDCQILKYLLPGLFAAIWIAALAIVSKGLLGVIAPPVFAEQADPNHAQAGSGAFYLPGFFKLRWLNVWSTSKSIVSDRKLPDPLQDIQNELRFEQAKLAYIRDVKLFRARIAYTISAIWIFLWIIVGTISLLGSTLPDGD